jgi:hypothetical protein
VAFLDRDPLSDVLSLSLWHSLIGISYQMYLALLCGILDRYQLSDLLSHSLWHSLYSKPSLIRINEGRGLPVIIRINEAKVVTKRQKRSRKQINGKFSNISSSNENKFKQICLSLEHPLWSSGQSSWLQILRSRVRFPALPDFLRSLGSGTGSTQPREYN